MLRKVANDLCNDHFIGGEDNEGIIEKSWKKSGLVSNAQKIYLPLMQFNNLIEKGAQIKFFQRMSTSPIWKQICPWKMASVGQI